MGLPKSSLDRLQRFQNARLIKGTKKGDPISLILLDLHWLPIAFRIDFKIALLTYRNLHHLAPRYLSSLLSLPVSSRLACDKFWPVTNFNEVPYQNLWLPVLQVVCSPALEFPSSECPYCVFPSPVPLSPEDPFNNCSI